MLYPVGMRIMLVGDTPLMNRLYVRFGESRSTEGRRQLEFWDPEVALALMLDFRPEVVINGVHHNTETPDAFVSNSRDPAVLSMYCNAIDAHLYHISDAMVFPGRQASTARDEPYPSKVFGLSRMLGERSVFNLHQKSTVVRVGWLYGPEIPESPPMIAWDHAKGDRKSALVYEDLIGSPTYVGDAARVLANNIIEQHYYPVVTPSHEGRIFHLSPAYIGSWYEYLTDAFPLVETTTVRSSTKFRDLHRNAGLVPSSGWEIMPGGIDRFLLEMQTGKPPSDLVLEVYADQSKGS